MSQNDKLIDLPFYSISNTEFNSLHVNDNNPTKCNFNKHYNLNNQDYATIQQINNIRNIQDKLSILIINSRSLNKNFTKLEILINLLNIKPTIIFVSETWINLNKPLLYSLKGYAFYNDPGDNKSGGAGLFIQNHINYKIINNYKFNIPNCEEIWAEITIPGEKSITIASLYRHPGNQINDFQNNLLKNIETLNRLNRNYIIGGDININLLSTKNFVTDYKNEILSQGILQLTKAPTRIQNNHISLLDHIYTNIEDYKLNTKCITFNISDHIPVLTILNSHKILSNLQVQMKI